MSTWRRVALLTLCLGVASPAAAIELPQKTELQKALKELEDAKANGHEIAQALEHLEDELSVLQEETAALAKAIQANEQEMAEKEASLSILSAEFDKKQKELQTQQTAFNKMVGTLLQMRRVPKGALINRDQTLEEQLRAASVADSTLRHIQEQADSLKQQSEELQTLKAKVSETQTELAKEHDVLLEQRGKLSSKVEARQSVYSNTKNNHQSVQTRIKKLAKESQSLQTLLAKLEKEREQLKTIGVPQPKPKRSKSSVNYTAGNKPLRMPAAGSVSGRFGEEVIAGEKLKGILLNTPKNATVTAPESGEIAFTGPFMDYGTMVIIRRDDAHHILVAGLHKTDAKVGQRVIAGEPIGRMGDVAPKQTELYLELRKDGKPIDPLPWIGKDAK